MIRPSGFGPSSMMNTIWEQHSNGSMRKAGYYQELCSEGERPAAKDAPPNLGSCLRHSLTFQKLYDSTQNTTTLNFPTLKPPKTPQWHRKCYRQLRASQEPASVGYHAQLAPHCNFRSAVTSPPMATSKPKPSHLPNMVTRQPSSRCTRTPSLLHTVIS
jgi:hypothetical protein